MCERPFSFDKTVTPLTNVLDFTWQDWYVKAFQYQFSFGCVVCF